MVSINVLGRGIGIYTNRSRLMVEELKYAQIRVFGDFEATEPEITEEEDEDDEDDKEDDTEEEEEENEGVFPN